MAFVRLPKDPLLSEKLRNIENPAIEIELLNGPAPICFSMPLSALRLDCWHPRVRWKGKFLVCEGCGQRFIDPRS